MTDNLNLCSDTGYCARGAFCKYSHGDDAIVPTQLFPMGAPMPFVPMLANGAMPYAMGGGAYDPRERMDMHQPGNGMGRPLHRPPVIPRHGDANGTAPNRPGELPVIQDLTPEVPPEERQAMNQDNSSVARTQPSQVNGSAHRAPFPSQIPMDVEMSAATNSQNGRPPNRGYRVPNSGVRGTFGSDVASFRPERRDDKTLVVEKIPGDKLSLGSVNEWFSKFGTVTNVAVDAVNAKALVSFSNHDEAHAAWKSEDAVFGNRFVKVFWHRPLEGHGQKGARMLAASAPLVANISTAREVPPSNPCAPSQTTAAPTPSVPKPSASTSALAAKQQLLEQQIAEQKSLMAKLSSASPQEKKDIMARLRKLNEEMKPTTTPASLPPVPSTSSSSPSTAKTSLPPDLKERERLDKELELHATGPNEGDAEESTEELKAKLAKLKAEAASLGLSEGSETQYSGGSSTYRPYRGRGRGGRGYYRGAMRGGPPRTSMKLDNRPRKLLVQGAGDGSLQAVRDWYEVCRENVSYLSRLLIADRQLLQTTGQVESAESAEGGDILVSFKSRAAAEQVSLRPSTCMNYS